MDRDIALQINAKLVAINTALQLIENGTSNAEPVGSLSMSPDRSVEDIPEESEAPEEPEPVTQEKK